MTTDKQNQLREILQKYNNPEWGDVIIDEICKLFDYPDTNQFVLKPIREVKTEDEARNIAIDWRSWANGDHLQLSYGELSEFADYFRKLGRKFKLTDEFKENGII